MIKTKVTVTETARNFSDIINRVAYKGERFILIKGRKAVAEISPVKPGRPIEELIDVLKELPKLSKEEAQAFADDLAEIRAEAGHDHGRDPWES